MARAVSRRLRRVRPTFAVVAGLLALFAVAEPVEAGKNNNYYKYRDKDGVLHVTNVPRRKGDWKLWKSFPGEVAGSGGRAAGHAPPRRDPVSMGSERIHRYDSLVDGASERYQLPPALIRAVMHTESNYNPNAVSYAGAMGLMQLMPATATFLGVQDAFDPRQNVYGGAKFLRLLANRFNGDMVLVLAGYHAGPRNVQKYGGVPPFETTRAYVKAVLRRYYAYEREEQLGGGGTRRGPARHIAG
jgi:hypothetical protein